jgi:hypothetical protein
LGEVLQGNELINSQLDIKFKGVCSCPHAGQHVHVLSDVAGSRHAASKQQQWQLHSGIGGSGRTCTCIHDFQQQLLERQRMDTRALSSTELQQRLQP